MRAHCEAPSDRGNRIRASSLSWSRLRGAFSASTPMQEPNASVAPLAATVAEARGRGKFQRFGTGTHAPPTSARSPPDEDPRSAGTAFRRARTRRRAQPGRNHAEELGAVGPVVELRQGSVETDRFVCLVVDRCFPAGTRRRGEDDRPGHVSHGAEPRDPGLHCRGHPLGLVVVEELPREALGPADRRRLRSSPLPRSPRSSVRPARRRRRARSSSALPDELAPEPAKSATAIAQNAA